MQRSSFSTGGTPRCVHHVDVDAVGRADLLEGVVHDLGGVLPRTSVEAAQGAADGPGRRDRVVRLARVHGTPVRLTPERGSSLRPRTAGVLGDDLPEGEDHVTVRCGRDVCPPLDDSVTVTSSEAEVMGPMREPMVPRSIFGSQCTA